MEPVEPGIPEFSINQAFLERVSECQFQRFRGRSLLLGQGDSVPDFYLFTGDPHWLDDAASTT